MENKSNNKNKIWILGRNATELMGSFFTIDYSNSYYNSQKILIGTSLVYLILTIPVFKVNDATIFGINLEITNKFYLDLIFFIILSLLFIVHFFRISMENNRIKLYRTPLLSNLQNIMSEYDNLVFNYNSMINEQSDKVDIIFENNSLLREYLSELEKLKLETPQDKLKINKLEKAISDIRSDLSERELIDKQQKELKLFEEMVFNREIDEIDDSIIEYSRQLEKMIKYDKSKVWIDSILPLTLTGISAVLSFCMIIKYFFHK